MSHLAKWLNNEKIQYVESVTDWQEALVIAGRPLLSEGAISQDYIDAIIQQKEEIGPFFVIAPQIAMPHARPGTRRTQTGVVDCAAGYSSEI
ncbi:UNVERIFIED_ORG: mannitol/fructose-specific phosphotransferase system IIA component (Ntr-type) [Pantoea brenneri]|nr:mannitol/fructose-specific phosphotransferase system IIA component (Ntr-type) [Pantoea brenneri]